MHVSIQYLKVKLMNHDFCKLRFQSTDSVCRWQKPVEALEDSEAKVSKTPAISHCLERQRHMVAGRWGVPGMEPIWIP